MNKKYIYLSLILSIIFISLFTIINYQEYIIYSNNYNSKLNEIILTLKEKYEIEDQEIVNIINNPKTYNNNYFQKIGIDLNDNSLLKVNENKYLTYTIINVIFLIVSFTSLIVILIINQLKQKKNINEITKLLEDINNKNYELHIEKISEDNFSFIKNEIYKTTILLKEAAENSLKDKIELKSSLEDISHQLKTPLTSILVMLDNIIDDPDMDKEVKDEFIKDIKREVININFLVQIILKLSKLDSNTIVFNKKDNKLNTIINESIKNINALCDLKNIKIIVDKQKDIIINCDSKWQIEAITNIIKNCIDHSPNNSNIMIICKDNKVYSSIDIIDQGTGISPKDLPHIFERFYKGENATSDSVGIGLSLAKKIINEDNGTISVTSNKNGTKFNIKYFK